MPPKAARPARRHALQLGLLLASLTLQGCVTTLVTAPVKIAYGTGKLAVKGTAAVVRAVVPGDAESDRQEKERLKADEQRKTGAALKGEPPASRP